MHGHRLRITSICRKCAALSIRKASTAAKLKPTSWDIPTPVSNSSLAAVVASKWARPTPAPRESLTRSPPRTSWPSRSTTPSAASLSSRPPPRTPGPRQNAEPLWSSPHRAASTPNQNRSANPRAWNARIETKTSENTSSTARDALPHMSPSQPAPPLRNNMPDRAPLPHQVRTDNAVPKTSTPDFHEVDPTQPDLPAVLPAQQRPREGSDKRRVVDFVEDDVETDTRHRRRQDVKAKGKGSILSRLHEGDFRDYNRSRAPRTVNSPGQPSISVKRKKTYGAFREKQVKVDVYIPSAVSVGQLAQLLGVRLKSLTRAMVRSGMGDETSPDYILTADYAALLAEEFHQNPIIDDELAFDIFPRNPPADSTSLPTRPPVVTIMGHVDHGKTTLLDTLRSTSVAKGEAGGITQHIGAFSVPVPGGHGTITFLDTPGHAAFSAMRARGALVTDIIVLVVAADDGIMPQTREVINLIKDANEKVAVVVAINKVDKPGSDTEAVKRALMAEGLELESFGGEIPAVEVSGLTGHNLPTLVETLSAVAELRDIRAEQDGPVSGYVLESRVTKGFGTVATVLVLRGCLKAGDAILAGLAQSKVRAMTDSAGNSVKAAYPGMAVTVAGWKSVPNAGDQVLQASEADIKKALVNRTRKAEIEASVKDVDAINQARREERARREAEEAAEDEADDVTEHPEKKGPKMVKLLIKADVNGSAEAVAGAIHGIGNELAKSQVISSHVGDVNESDVLTARAANASVVAFSVKVPKAIEQLAQESHVPIISSTIIYRLVESVTDAVIGELPKVINTTVTGEASILQIFELAVKGGTRRVAGCRVTQGIIQKFKKARVLRNGVVMHEGTMDSMRILKKDVTEIRKGTECGMSLLDYQGIEAGDVIQCIEVEELPGSI